MIDSQHQKGKSYLPLRTAGENQPLFYLTPYPQKLKLKNKRIDLSDLNLVCRPDRGMEGDADRFMTDVRAVLGSPVQGKINKAKYTVDINIRDLGLVKEGYALEITEEGIKVTGQDRAGSYYGTQTLLQIIGFEKANLPCLSIRDWPAYHQRSVMLDMGRGIYSKALIERVIRIMARLKLNLLHLHLYDDELMGVRFDRMPLGKENAHALPVKMLSDIVTYARNFHIAVCPEMESWGHVNSVVFHYPECYGAKGMYGGASFGIGRKTFGLLERIYDEVVPCLEPESLVHLGMDEANWKVLPDMAGCHGLNPEWLVGHLYDLILQVGKMYRKRLQVCLWADHGGRPVPTVIQKQVIIQPWNYWEQCEAEIRKKARYYARSGNGPFMFGAGNSGLQFHGAFGATRIWAESSKKAKNCLGGTICLWEGNTLDQYMISLYAGSASLWNPDKSLQPAADDSYRESLTGRLARRMMSWQTLFHDADPAAIIRDRGPAVYLGYYVSGPRAGKPAAQTAFQINEQ